MSERKQREPLLGLDLFGWGKMPSPLQSEQFVEKLRKKSQENVNPSILGMQASAQQVQKRKSLLGKQIPSDAVLFPNGNEIVTNRHGIFIPRSRLGDNYEYEERDMSDGSVRITVTVRKSAEPAVKPIKCQPLDCSREIKWLKEHGKEYSGEWVALDGDHLIFHSKNAKEVYEAARKSGVELPLVVQVESSDNLPFGGW